MAMRTDAPNFSQGWGVAGLITAMAVGAFLLAGYIKRTTFRSPNDPTAVTAPATEEHAAPSAEGAKH
jgi:hypothetical protein